MGQFDVKQTSKDARNSMVSFDFAKTPITQIADYIIIAASKNNASDLHFDPREKEMIVRFRIDGELQDYTFIPKSYERNLITRLKLLANMNITESRLPQDGAIKGMYGDTYLDMRVSCLPLNEGEKIVIRILDYTRSLQGIDSLGFNATNLKKLRRMMLVPNGIILVTGATGSGKSTTTYSILQALNKPETNIITVEDPIEMNIQGINQVQVNAEIGMTFAAALRSILRQDPNIILIGEIRDSETAQIAVRASITGHLVLSTIHTNNSLSTIERLLDMDVERYLLSTALTGIISQRLAKQLCPKCRYQRATTKYEKKVFKKFINRDIATIWEANPNGCPNCRKGYKGRIAIQEVLELDEEIRNALNNEKIEREELSKMVYTNKTITLLQDALGKALEGKTSFEEVYRAIEIESEDNETYTTESTQQINEAINEEVAVLPPTTNTKELTPSKQPLTPLQKNLLTEELSKTPKTSPIPNTNPNTSPTTKIYLKPNENTQTQNPTIPNTNNQIPRTTPINPTTPTQIPTSNTQTNTNVKSQNLLNNQNKKTAISPSSNTVTTNITTQQQPQIPTPNITTNKNIQNQNLQNNTIPNTTNQLPVATKTTTQIPTPNNQSTQVNTNNTILELPKIPPISNYSSQNNITNTIKPNTENQKNKTPIPVAIDPNSLLTNNKLPTANALQITQEKANNTTLPTAICLQIPKNENNNNQPILPKNNQQTNNIKEGQTLINKTPDYKQITPSLNKNKIDEKILTPPTKDVEKL